MAAGFAGIHHQGCDDFGAWLSLVVGWVRRKWKLFRGAMPLYPVDAPSSIAMCRKVVRNGNDCGKCMTMRRAEATTLAPSFRKRSRSVQTCALAQFVPADRSYAVENMSKAKLLGTSLQRRSGIGDRDEVFAGFVLALYRANPVEEIVQENVWLQRAAGFGRDDEQRLAEIDGMFDRLDLSGVAAVQHVEARPAGLPSERFA